MITHKDVADKLISYLLHNISLEELVNWAEKAMMEEDFEEEYFDIIKEIVSRLGVADVIAFGLTWEDCERYLDCLGYKVSLKILETSDR
ncbi:TPA: hypothetical protein GXX44_06275 [bacterium]|nr:hypothetical protein [bacterium]